MAVADRVKSALDALQRDELVDALIQVSIAIDATAKHEYPSTKKVGERCMAFLRENQGFITRVATGIIEVPGEIRYEWPTDPRGYKTHEEVLYHVVRCGLLHEGELSSEVEIVHDTVIGVSEEGRVLLPVSFIVGMVLSVIGAKSNRSQRLPGTYTAKIGASVLDLNTFWGRRDDMHRLAKERNQDESSSAA